MRSHLHVKTEFTSRDLKDISKKLPPVGIELATLDLRLNPYPMGHRGLCYLTDL